MKIVYVLISLLFFVISGCTASLESPDYKFEPLVFQSVVGSDFSLVSEAKDLLLDYTELAPSTIGEMSVSTVGVWRVYDFNLEDLCGRQGCLYLITRNGSVKSEFVKKRTHPDLSLWAYQPSYEILRYYKLSDREGFVDTVDFRFSSGSIVKETGTVAIDLLR